MGRWRITSIKGWDESDVDLLGPAYIELTARNHGDFRFVALRGEIDYRVSLGQKGPQIDWTWVGDDDGAEVSGRGWAYRDGDTLKGTFFVFLGDDVHFEAALFKPRRASR
ncbi:MAG: hypothetical protein QOK37_2951 [Thermoanaerobaculia bacterium]|nr:hypothetical protein [Thermoanaerobaculia bacterium]